LDAIEAGDRAMDAPAAPLSANSVD
jgi:hypothetical protein